MTIISCNEYIGAIALCLLAAACGLDASDPGDSPDVEDETHAQTEQGVTDEDCGGNLIFRKTAKVDGTAIGELVVYYNSSNGNNCARFNHLGPAYGVSRYTSVWLDKCSTTNPGNGCAPVLIWGIPDDGPFSYHAGPVRVHSPQNCVRAEGRIHWDGSDRVVSTGGVIGC